MKFIKLSKMIMVAGIAVLLCVGTSQAAKKKVLFIDSYHAGYAWSDGEVQGAKSVIGDKYDFKVIHMDTKRNSSAEAQKKAAEEAKAEIDSWKPDVVITADDNAAKLVIVPFYKDSDVPFVFCGINWDASSYGFPSKNVTGVLEVSVVKPLLDSMQKFAKGSRVGFIGKDNETDRKEADQLKKLGVQLSATKFVNTFEEWKTEFTKLQDEADMLIVINNAGISGWDDTEAMKFTRENTKIPTGSSHDFIAPFVLIDYAKLAEEQGELAAGIAMNILEGKPIKDFPIVSNKKGQMYVNLAIAKKLGVQFPLEMLKAAKVVKD
ncbi:MAG: ABC transporter substrate binding protein [Pseudomonadota bacterium]